MENHKQNIAEIFKIKFSRRRRYVERADSSMFGYTLLSKTPTLRLKGKANTCVVMVT